MLLLVYSALLIGPIISSAFAAPNTLTQGIPTITRSTTVTTGEEGVPIIVSVVTSISTVSAPVVIQINPNAPSPAPPQKTITEVVEPVNSASSPAGAQSVIKLTKTPVRFTDNFSTCYPWDHNGRKEKMGDRHGGNQESLMEVPSGWTPPAGFPSALTKYGRIGKRGERDMEAADIPTSFRTLTAFAPAAVVTAINPAPPPLQGKQLLPGQIPTTRSDLDGIAVGQGEWEPADIKELHTFSWDADHPEYVSIGGKYANLVSTLVKHAPSLAPEPTP